MAHEIRRTGDRVELIVDGDVASYADVQDRGGDRAVLHTETVDGYEGQGLAGELVTAMLAEIRAQGVGLLPFCPYVRHVLDTHPDDVELVPLDRRAEFGL